MYEEKKSQTSDFKTKGYLLSKLSVPYEEDTRIEWDSKQKTMSLLGGMESFCTENDNLKPALYDNMMTSLYQRVLNVLNVNKDGTNVTVHRKPSTLGINFLNKISHNFIENKRKQDIKYIIWWKDTQMLLFSIEICYRICCYKLHGIVIKKLMPTL